MRESKEELEAQIMAILALKYPEVELVDLELRGSPTSTLTLFVDRPGGVDLDLCAAVSQELDQLRERYSLEVSSPGLNRRLRKPAHFAAALEQTVAVRLLQARNGRRKFTGKLVAAQATTIILELPEGERVELPLAEVAQANVVYDFGDDGGHRE